MTNVNSILGIMVSIILGALMALIGSQNSIMLNGYPLFAVCASIGFLLHWIMFLPAYIYQTEHYFDLTGSISYLTVTIFAIIITISHFFN